MKKCERCGATMVKARSFGGKKKKIWHCRSCGHTIPRGK